MSLLVSWPCDGGDLGLPSDTADKNETFSVEVALVDEDGNVVPLPGIFI
jgi:hypothetical protein